MISFFHAVKWYAPNKLKDKLNNAAERRRCEKLPVDGAPINKGIQSEKKGLFPKTRRIPWLPSQPREPRKLFRSYISIERRHAGRGANATGHAAAALAWNSLAEPHSSRGCRGGPNDATNTANRPSNPISKARARGTFSSVLHAPPPCAKLFGNAWVARSERAVFLCRRAAVCHQAGLPRP